MTQSLREPSGGSPRDELLDLIKSIKEQVISAQDMYVYVDGERSAARKETHNTPYADKETSMSNLCREVLNCRRCGLHKTRKNIVFGEGAVRAKIVFVGEAPGADEDVQGRPFVGRAGQLLTDIIVKGMRLRREDVYICNILKCRPPGNRNPSTEEISQCEPFLKQQLQLIRPQVICALGKFAAQVLLKTETQITALRGRFQDYEGIRLLPTYHPAYLLRNPPAKKQVWEDVQMMMNEIGLPIL